MNAFTLEVHCDADGNPEAWYQVVGRQIQQITDDVFDALVGTPCCKGVQVTSDEEEDDE